MPLCGRHARAGLPRGVLPQDSFPAARQLTTTTATGTRGRRDRVLHGNEGLATPRCTHTSDLDGKASSCVLAVRSVPAEGDLPAL